MSINQIIKEAINKEPISMKKTLEEELRARVRLALEAKMAQDDEEEDDEDEEELDEAKGMKPFFGVKDGKAYAVNLSNAKGGNEPRNMGWLMDNNTTIKDFMKDAKKHYVDAKGKATLPAVKKAVKMLDAGEFYASWKADSPSYKDDSFVLYYKD